MHLREYISREIVCCGMLLLLLVSLSFSNTRTSSRPLCCLTCWEMFSLLIVVACIRVWNKIMKVCLLLTHKEENEEKIRNGMNNWIDFQCRYNDHKHNWITCFMFLLLPSQISMLPFPLWDASNYFLHPLFPLYFFSKVGTHTHGSPMHYHSCEDMCQSAMERVHSDWGSKN